MVNKLSPDDLRQITINLTAGTNEKRRVLFYQLKFLLDDNTILSQQLPCEANGISRIEGRYTAGEFLKTHRNIRGVTAYGRNHYCIKKNWRYLRISSRSVR